MAKINIGKKFIRTKVLLLLVLVSSIFLSFFELLIDWFPWDVSLYSFTSGLVIMSVIVLPIGISIDLFQRYKQGKW
jgi:hypothetical protein